MSHNAKDKPRMHRLAERLRDAGLRIWFDEWVIRPGDGIYLAADNAPGNDWARRITLKDKDLTVEDVFISANAKPNP